MAMKESTHMKMYREIPRTVHAQRLTENSVFVIGDTEIMCSKGDWLVVDANGRRTVCDDATFRYTYEPVVRSPLPDEGQLKRL